MIEKNLTSPKPWLITSLLSAMLMLGACQPKDGQNANTNVNTNAEQSVKKEADLPATQSESAAAQIAKYQPMFVVEMQNLQRRLQAEFESLEAADAAEDLALLMPTGAGVSADGTDLVDAKPSNIEAAAKAVNDKAVDEKEPSETNINTEVGERDLEVLKRVTLEPKAPKLLPEDELIDRYQEAMSALYEPESKALSAEQIDTLLNIAATIPQVFDNLEIAERLTLKSPALGRLIVQSQVSRQIEAQQAADIEKMKSEQQQEFDELVSKFDETIQGYDKQIADYEKTLKEIKKK
ncbi:hypothetical protein [Psychrobacter ciconiae]|uniref:hypothetical protein n=1 Tax=Psychrobacter ciconiae TaxID=1553449 RepID=UPI001918086F|nr:hypothetical protein [Psychrobacter ciconiae]